MSWTWTRSQTRSRGESSMISSSKHNPVWFLDIHESISFISLLLNGVTGLYPTYSTVRWRHYNPAQVTSPLKGTDCHTILQLTQASMFLDYNLVKPHADTYDHFPPLLVPSWLVWSQFKPNQLRSWVEGCFSTAWEQSHYINVYVGWSLVLLWNQFFGSRARTS